MRRVCITVFASEAEDCDDCKKLEFCMYQGGKSYSVGFSTREYLSLEEWCEEMRNENRRYFRYEVTEEVDGLYNYDPINIVLHEKEGCVFTNTIRLCRTIREFFALFNSRTKD